MSILSLITDNSKSFIANMLYGNFDWNLISSFFNSTEIHEDSNEVKNFLTEFKSVLLKYFNPVEIEKERQFKTSALEKLKENGYYGICVDKKYGGLGYSLRVYLKAMMIAAEISPALAVHLAAHQVVGLCGMIDLYGTLEQKEKYLPLLAQGHISGFAGSEPDVGIAFHKAPIFAKLDASGQNYILNGEKIYIGNGNIASFVGVLARTSITENLENDFTVFLVETNSSGFKVVQNHEFMGLKGLSNAYLKFENVKVPVFNVIGKVGHGLPLVVSGMRRSQGWMVINSMSLMITKNALKISNEWVVDRKLSELPIIQRQTAEMVASYFSLESLFSWCYQTDFEHSSNYLIEIGAFKNYLSEYSFPLIHQALLFRGARGYESKVSLAKRNEGHLSIENLLSDSLFLSLVEHSTNVLPQTLFSTIACTTVNKNTENITRTPTFQSLSEENKNFVKCFNEFGKTLAQKFQKILPIWKENPTKNQNEISLLIKASVEVFCASVSLSYANYLIEKKPESYDEVNSIVKLCNISCKEKIELYLRRLNNINFDDYIKVSQTILNSKNSFINSLFFSDKNANIPKYILEEKTPERLNAVSKIYNPLTSQFIKEKLKIKKSDRVLEIACGFGHVTEIILSQLEYSGKYVGLDLNVDALNYVNNKWKHLNKNFCQFLNFDLEDIHLLKDDKRLQPFEKYDVIYGRFILAHLKKGNIPRFLENIKKLLAPGGVIAFEEISNLGNWLSSLKLFFEEDSFILDKMIKSEEILGLDFAIGDHLPNLFATLDYRNIQAAVVHPFDSNGIIEKTMFRKTMLEASKEIFLAKNICSESEVSSLENKSILFEKNENLYMKFPEVTQIFANL